MLSRRFHFLWITQSLSGFGDVLYILAIVTALYERSGSAAAASLFPLMRVAAMTLGGIAAPLAADRFRLSRLLAGCLAGQSLLFGGLSLYLGIVESDSEIPVLIGFVFAISCFEGTARPVRFALVPRVVGKNNLLKANSMMAAAEQIIGLASWGVGGLLLAALSTFAAIRLTFILQIAAFAVSIWIREEAGYYEAQKAAEEKFRWSALREGWTYAFRHPILRLLLTMDAWEGLFGSVFAGAFLLVFVQEQLHRGEAWWGWLNAAYFLGLICGSALMGRYFARKGSALTEIMVAGSGLYGLLTFAFAWTTQPWLAAALVGGSASSIRCAIFHSVLYFKPMPPHICCRRRLPHNPRSLPPCTGVLYCCPVGWRMLSASVRFICLLQARFSFLSRLPSPENVFSIKCI
jgi:MFS family permease